MKKRTIFVFILVLYTMVSSMACGLTNPSSNDKQGKAKYQTKKQPIVAQSSTPETSTGGTKEAPQPNYHNWMERHHAYIKDKRLNEMLLLGSHDSGTKATTDRDYTSRDPKIRLILEGPIETKLIDIVGLAKAQSTQLVEQLNAGIRYFDVRLQIMEHTNTIKTYTRFFHGVVDVKTPTATSILTEVADWAAKHPKEFFILDFQQLQLDGTTKDTRLNVRQDKGYQAILAHALRLNDIRDKTYAELVQDNASRTPDQVKNIVVLLPSYSIPNANCGDNSREINRDCFLHSPWHKTLQVRRLLNGLEETKAIARKSKAVGTHSICKKDINQQLTDCQRFVVYQCQRTPSALGPSLKELASISNPSCAGFLHSLKSEKEWGIVMIDFVSNWKGIMMETFLKKIKAKPYHARSTTHYKDKFFFLRRGWIPSRYDWRSQESINTYLKNTAHSVYAQDFRGTPHAECSQKLSHLGYFETKYCVLTEEATGVKREGRKQIHTYYPICCKQLAKVSKQPSYEKTTLYPGRFYLRPNKIPSQHDWKSITTVETWLRKYKYSTARDYRGGTKNECNKKLGHLGNFETSYCDALEHGSGLKKGARTDWYNGSPLKYYAICCKQTAARRLDDGQLFTQRFFLRPNATPSLADWKDHESTAAWLQANRTTYARDYRGGNKDECNKKLGHLGTFKTLYCSMTEPSTGIKKDARFYMGKHYYTICCEQTKVKADPTKTPPNWINWADACPDGWKMSGYDKEKDSVTCLPDKENVGICQGPFTFKKVDDRCGWANKCKVAWTSANCQIPSWATDDKQKCPNGWYYEGFVQDNRQYVCQPNGFNMGKCANIPVLYTHISQKCTMASQCGILWGTCNGETGGIKTESAARSDSSDNSDGIELDPSQFSGGGFVAVSTLKKPMKKATTKPALKRQYHIHLQLFQIEDKVKKTNKTEKKGKQQLTTRPATKKKTPSLPKALQAVLAPLSLSSQPQLFKRAVIRVGHNRQAALALGTIQQLFVDMKLHPPTQKSSNHRAIGMKLSLSKQFLLKQPKAQFVYQPLLRSDFQLFPGKPTLLGTFTIHAPQAQTLIAVLRAELASKPTSSK